MKVNETLKRQIVIEIFALLFLIAAICYAVFAINKGQSNKVTSVKGFVTVLDDSKYTELKPLSDGEGLDQEGITFTITNNNKEKTSYKIVVVPNVTDEKVLENIRVSINDLYVYDLTELEKVDDGYSILLHELDAGYTKVHLIKFWYKLGTETNVKKVDFSFSLVR